MSCLLKILCISIIIVIILIFFGTNIDTVIGGSTNTEYNKANCLICNQVGINGQLSNWNVLHMLLFIIFGILCPNNYIYIIFIGIIWEFIELFFEYLNKVNHNSFYCKYMPNSCAEKISSDEFWNHYFGIKKYKNSLYWCSSGFIGQIIDIIFNTIGIYIGILIAKSNYFN
jgi:hypothetical protein